MYGIDTSRVEEIPAKEPKFHAMPLKSALKKKGGTGSSGPATPQSTPTQENRPLTFRQELHASFKYVLYFYSWVSCFEGFVLFSYQIK